MSLSRASNVGPAWASFGAAQIVFSPAAANAVTLNLLTIPEVLPGDTVLLAPHTSVPLIALMPGYVISQGTVRIPVVNLAGSIQAPPPTMCDYVVIRKAGGDAPGGGSFSVNSSQTIIVGG